ncbi:MAG: helix-turn-helix transcriptional regulator [Chloroflexi bacterium]|nr:helix-turn-helix transcriptional regulator [Chloroflexota bacterium]
MSYQTSDKTRQRKDAKRTAMMQAAVRVFADKGYYAATVRDIAGCGGGHWHVLLYFPDKETLFVYLRMRKRPIFSCKRCNRR